MNTPTVFIVDDDPVIRFDLQALLEMAGLKSVGFASSEEFLKFCHPDMAGCMVLDVQMAGMSGPELQQELLRRDIRLPIVFLTSHADLPTGLQALKQGAVDFLTKPVAPEALLACVRVALERASALRQAEAQRRQLDASLHKLTGREHEVLSLALSGLPNKTIATQLQIGLRTVEVYRSRILLKCDAVSFLVLAQRIATAGVDPAKIVPSGEPTGD